MLFLSTVFLSLYFGILRLHTKQHSQRTFFSLSIYSFHKYNFDIFHFASWDHRGCIYSFRDVFHVFLFISSSFFLTKILLQIAQSREDAKKIAVDFILFFPLLLILLIWHSPPLLLLLLYWVFFFFSLPSFGMLTFYLFATGNFASLFAQVFRLVFVEFLSHHSN